MRYHDYNDTYRTPHQMEDNVRKIIQGIERRQLWKDRLFYAACILTWVLAMGIIIEILH
jgi:hypothetical protein